MSWKAAPTYRMLFLHVALLFMLHGVVLAVPGIGSNLSLPNPLPGLPEYQCVNDQSWSADRFYPWACLAAFEHAKSVEASVLRTKFEFLPNNAPPQTRYPRMDTPRRYNVGGCTVAIVLLDFFGPDDLPGQPPGRRRYDRSVTTFNTIFQAGQFVKEGCIQYGRRPSPGWNNAGKISPLIPLR